MMKHAATGTANTTNTSKASAIAEAPCCIAKRKRPVAGQVNLLQSENSQQSQTIELLQQKVQVLQAAKGEMNEEEKKSFEKRLTQYIREIDRCITMLGE
jgi:hypothetical protein